MLLETSLVFVTKINADSSSGYFILCIDNKGSHRLRKQAALSENTGKKRL